MPTSNASLKDENCADITDWDDVDLGSGASTQETFDSKTCFKFLTGTTDYSAAKRIIDVGSFGNRVVVSLSLYCDLIGTQTSLGTFRLLVSKSNRQCYISFCSDGLFVYDGSAQNEVGTNIVSQDTWQEWTFDIDFTNQTVDVYLGENLVGDNKDCSYGGSFTEGSIEIAQGTGMANNLVSYVDWIKIGDNFAGASLTKDLTDSVSLSEAIIKTAKPVKADTINLSDAVIKNCGKILSDATSLSDGIIKGFSTLKSDNISLSDALTNIAVGLLKSDTITLTDVVIKKDFGMNKSDTITLTDAFDRVVAFIRAFASTLTLTDGMVKNVGLNETDTINLLEGYNKLIGKGLADGITLADLVFLTSIITLADAISLSDASVRAVELLKTDSINLVDAQAKNIQIAQADNINLTELINVIKAILDSQGGYTWIGQPDLGNGSWGARAGSSDSWVERGPTTSPWTERTTPSETYTERPSTGVTFTPSTT